MLFQYKEDFKYSNLQRASIVAMLKWRINVQCITTKPFRFQESVCREFSKATDKVAKVTVQIEYRKKPKPARCYKHKK